MLSRKRKVFFTIFCFIISYFNVIFFMIDCFIITVSQMRLVTANFFSGFKGGVVLEGAQE